MRLLLSYRCDAFELWMRPRKPLQCWRFHLFMLITCWLFSFRHHTQTPQPSPLAVPNRSGEGRRSPRGGSLGLCFLSDNSQTQSRHSQLLGGSFQVPLLCLVFLSLFMRFHFRTVCTLVLFQKRVPHHDQSHHPPTLLSVNLAAIRAE